MLPPPRNSLEIDETLGGSTTPSCIDKFRLICDSSSLTVKRPNKLIDGTRLIERFHSCFGFGVVRKFSREVCRQPIFSKSTDVQWNFNWNNFNVQRSPHDLSSTKHYALPLSVSRESPTKIFRGFLFSFLRSDSRSPVLLLKMKTVVFWLPRPFFPTHQLAVCYRLSHQALSSRFLDSGWVFLKRIRERHAVVGKLHKDGHHWRQVRRFSGECDSEAVWKFGMLEFG